MTRQIPWLRVFVEGVVIVGKLAVVLLFVGCAPSNQRLGVRAAAPDDTYSCYVQVLAEMEYNQVGEADRSSGFIRAVKGLYEATVTITTASSGDGSDVAVTIRRFIETRRTGTCGTRLNTEGWRDLETLAEACGS